MSTRFSLPVPPPRPVHPESGLTPDEQAVMDHLVAAWSGFAALPHTQAADDLADFRRAIHEAQRILARRVIGREFPDYWLRKDEP